MLQNIDGVDVYVVDLKTVPELPITYCNEIEKPYALCLAQAIRDKTITEPGKYGIHVTYDDNGMIYKIARIIEP